MIVNCLNHNTYKQLKERLQIDDPTIEEVLGIINKIQNETQIWEIIEVQNYTKDLEDMGRRQRTSSR